MLPQPLILLWTVHPGDLLGEPIEFLTHGPVTHAGFLRSDGKTVHENYLPQVRNRPILEAEKPGVRVFALEGMTTENAAALERYFDLAAEPQTALKYSIANLFDYALNRPPASEADGLDCSAYVTQTLRRRAPALTPLLRCEDWQVSPVDLLRSVRLTEITWADVPVQT